MATSNKRQVRLGQKWERLQEVNRDSDYVRVEVLDVLPGRAPEKYKVTFKCRELIAHLRQCAQIRIARISRH